MGKNPVNNNILHVQKAKDPIIYKDPIFYSAFPERAISFPIISAKTIHAASFSNPLSGKKCKTFRLDVN